MLRLFAAVVYLCVIRTTPDACQRRLETLGLLAGGNGWAKLASDGHPTRAADGMEGTLEPDGCFVIVCVSVIPSLLVSMFLELVEYISVCTTRPFM